MLGAFASLLLTLGMLGLGVWALRRFAPGAARPAGGRLPLEVIRRVATGPKHGGHCSGLASGYWSSH